MDTTLADKKLGTEKFQLTQEQRDALRFDAVREAYWEATDPAAGEWSNLQDALRDAGITSPTTTQCRALFDMLPRTLIGKGIARGFDSHSVRDDILEFAQENRDFIYAVLAAHGRHRK
jgi:hypothetical protein